MTHTVVSSHKKEIAIGFDQPFCVIGERINPTGRKKLAAEMAAGDYSTVEADALAQVAAGARMLDVNAGIPLADEPAILAESIKLVQSLVDVPLSIDSSIVEALERGLEVYQGKPLVNSVTGEEERLEVVLPLIKKYGAAVVAISNDETGISEDPDVRFEVAKKIVERAAGLRHSRRPTWWSIPWSCRSAPSATPASAAFRLIRRLREELGVNTTCGASNVSFGLPNRHALNGDASSPWRPVQRHDLGDHESDARRGNDRYHGGQRVERRRPQLQALDQEVPRSPPTGSTTPASAKDAARAPAGTGELD